MPRIMYEVLREGLLETNGCYLQKQDALRKLRALTDQWMVSSGLPASPLQLNDRALRLFCRPDKCSLTNIYVDDNSCLISE
jgi:hypothetical protein